MQNFRTSHIVKHTPQQMFDLVADMESYPQFVPLCKSVRNRRRFIGQGGTETVISVSFPPVATKRRRMRSDLHKGTNCG